MPATPQAAPLCRGPPAALSEPRASGRARVGGSLPRSLPNSRKASSLSAQPRSRVPPPRAPSRHKPLLPPACALRSPPPGEPLAPFPKQPPAVGAPPAPAVGASGPSPRTDDEVSLLREAGFGRADGVVLSRGAWSHSRLGGGAVVLRGRLSCVLTPRRKTPRLRPSVCPVLPAPAGLGGRLYVFQLFLPSFRRGEDLRTWGGGTRSSSTSAPPPRRSAAAAEAPPPACNSSSPRSPSSRSRRAGQLPSQRPACQHSV